MAQPIISEVWDIDEIYTNFDRSFLAALRALRDTQRLNKAQALHLMFTIKCRADEARSVTSILRLTQKCDAVTRRYGNERH